jgi:chaperone modulatory protein CbpM
MTADPNHPGQLSGQQFTSFILEDQSGLTFDDLCRACAVQSELIVELVDEGVLTPDVVTPAGALSATPGDWRFTGFHIHRVRMAVRLQRDLGVNLAGAALVLDLLDEMETLKAQLRRLSSG